MTASADELPHPFGRPPRPGAAPLVSPGTLHELLDRDPPPVLVDVRDARERRWARFSGDRHLPLHELPRRYDELPRDRPVVVYDQFGADARRGVDLLQRHGFTLAVALEGGLDEYARLVDPSIPRYRPGGRNAEVIVRQFARPETGCLTYLLADAVNQRAVIVDPGRDVEPYLGALHDGQLELTAVIETHTHADHLGGHSAIHARTGAPIFLSHRSNAQYPHRTLAEDSGLTFGALELEVLETPGHTRDHLTLKLEDRVFTGDTLLLGACGRTDLGDGSPELLWGSLMDKLLKLPDDTEVFPAHFGPHHALIERFASSIGFERFTNEALNQGTQEAFLRYMTEGWPPKPVDFDQIVRTNLAQ